MNTLGILLEGHVRTGLEDNIYLRKGVLAKGNSPFVKRLVKLSESLDRPVATPREAREILGLANNHTT